MAMTRRYTILDLATAPIPDAGAYVEPASAPANYRDPVKIAAWKQEKAAERLAAAAVDLDLARITAIGLSADDTPPTIFVAEHESDERTLLEVVAARLCLPDEPPIITYGGLRFDLPLIQRRARYLGVNMPRISLDRFRTPHLDLCDILSDRDPSRRRPLGFYVRRLGWTDLVKPLDGAEEARIFAHQRWSDLIASVRHDVVATRRLAQWLGVIPQDEPAEPPRSLATEPIL